MGLKVKNACKSKQKERTSIQLPEHSALFIMFVFHWPLPRRVSLIWISDQRYLQSKWNSELNSELGKWLVMWHRWWSSWLQHCRAISGLCLETWLLGPIFLMSLAKEQKMVKAEYGWSLLRYLTLLQPSWPFWQVNQCTEDLVLSVHGLCILLFFK